MTLGQVHDQISAIGGSRNEDAYPLFWAHSESGQFGYHDYYELPDDRCIQVQVVGRHSDKLTEFERSHKVVQFELGSKGEPYVGKMKWFDDEKAGRHTRPASVDLTALGKPSK